MPLKQKKVHDMLASAKDATVPSKKGFDEAWSAIPAYREYMRSEVMARSSYTIDDEIVAFLKNRLRDIRSMTVLTVDGLTIVFEYVRSTGKYIMRVCEKALETVISAVDKE